MAIMNLNTLVEGNMKILDCRIEFLEEIIDALLKCIAWLFLMFSISFVIIILWVVINSVDNLKFLKFIFVF